MANIGQPEHQWEIKPDRLPWEEPQELPELDPAYEPDREEVPVGVPGQ